MAMKEALVARLTGAAPIAAFVGSKVSWGGFQRGDVPNAIALFMIFPGEDWTHDGPDGLDRPRVQIDCRSTAADTAEAMAKAVRDEMRQLVEVGGIRFHQGMRDGEETNDDGEQEGGGALFRVSQDFLFYFEEI